MPASVVLTLLLAQTPPIEAGEAAQIERIRRALTEASAITAPPVTGADGTVFRMTVYGRKPEQPLWEEWSAVPSYVRPQFPSYHYEFLQQVTPEAFRAGTLYPGAVSPIPLGRVIQILAKQIKAANRKRQEANAREEVRQALEALRACRENPARPGCR
jgi:hypothetical protein